jgi:hypothetical protein
MSSNKTITIYPIFVNCKKYTTDDYWHKILDECSMGNIPYGMRYDEKHNMIRYKCPKSGKLSSISIDPTNNLDFYRTMMQIFKSIFNMRSDMDIESKRDKLKDEEREILKIYEVGEWKKIKPKNQKSLYILNYCLEMQHLHKLSDIKTKALIGFINIKLTEKIINETHIEFVPGRIVSIRYLTIDKNGKAHFDDSKK